MEPEKNNLNVFRILFLVKGILSLIFSLFFVFYAFMGFFVNYQIENAAHYGPAFNPGYLFVIIGTIGFLIAIALGVLALLSSKFIKERRNYNFIYIAALINVLSGVLGILLAIFTLIELSKPHVKALFYAQSTTPTL